MAWRMDTWYYCHWALVSIYNVHEALCDYPLLTILLNFCSLIALKVLVGINLLGYAYKRYASMQAREEEERKKDELHAEMDKDEKVCGKFKIGHIGADDMY